MRAQDQCICIDLSARTVKKTLFILPGLMLFTSGSTDLPKAVHYQYETVYRYLLWCQNEFKLDDQDNVLFTTELSFIASLRPLFVTLLSGAKVTFNRGTSGNKLQWLIDSLINNKITVLNITPTLFSMLLSALLQIKASQSLLSVRMILLSGEPIDIETINYWLKNINTHTVFYNLYGATEYLVPFYKKINAPEKEEERLNLGRLRDGCSYHLLTDALDTYKLYIAGDIATGYFDSALTNNHYQIINNQRYIKSHDLIKMCDEQLFFSSRTSRIIKKYGLLINLDQIEEVLKNWNKKLTFVVVTKEDDGHSICLLIVGSQHDDTLLEQIKYILETGIPSYMHPTEYFFTQDPPLTASGKLNYLQIKKLFPNYKSPTISHYFARYFKDHVVHENAKLIDLGLDSIDYIEMAEALLKSTGKWLDISKLNDNTRIVDIPSCLIDYESGIAGDNFGLKLNEFQQKFYSYELKNNKKREGMCFIDFLCLTNDIDISRLKKAIFQTIDSHFVLKCCLGQAENKDLFLVETTPQKNLDFKRSLFFSKNDYVKLKTTLHSERLVSIYLERRNNLNYMIIAYHHIALDGWSNMLVREEIFRRYENHGPIIVPNAAEEIQALNNANLPKRDVVFNFDEIKSTWPTNGHSQYNQLDDLFFSDSMEAQSSCFVVEKKDVQRYAQDNNVSNMQYSVIFTLLFYQIIESISGTHKLCIGTSLSNRYLPISGVKELITNLATGLPIYLDKTNLTPKQFAEVIKKKLHIYFKHMTYGAFSGMINDPEVAGKFYSRHFESYFLTYTYINKVTNKAYRQNNYIDWSRSISETPKRNNKFVFFRVYNMGTQFVIHLNSHMKTGLHHRIANGIKNQQMISTR